MFQMPNKETLEDTQFTMFVGNARFEQISVWSTLNMLKRQEKKSKIIRFMKYSAAPKEK